MKGYVFMKTILKKIGYLFFVAVLLTMAFTSCGGEDVEIDMDDVIKANSTEELLKSYDSVLGVFEDETGEYGYYVDETLGYIWSEGYGYSEIVTQALNCGVDEYGYYSVLYAGMEIDTSYFASIAFDVEMFKLEEVVKCKRKGDTITLTTEIDIDALSTLGYEYDEEYDGGYFITEYTLDAETYVVQKMKERFVYEDGSKTFSKTTEIQYNTARPETADALYTRITEASDLRTVTFILDPDTADEAAYSVSIPKGDSCFFYWPDDYSDAYLDRECTLLYEGDDDTTSDLTLYAKK